MKRITGLIVLAACLALVGFSVASAETMWTKVHGDQSTEGMLKGISIVDEDTLFFASEHTVWTGLEGINGENHMIYKSTNGGQDLESLFSLGVGIADEGGICNIMTYVHDVHFFDENNGLWAGTTGCLFQGNWKAWVAKINYDSTEGEWVISEPVMNPAMPTGLLDGPGAGREMREIEFVNDTIGFATSDVQYIYKTIDAGETWDILPAAPPVPAALEIGRRLTDFSVIDENKFFISGFDEPYGDDDDDDTWDAKDEVTEYADEGVLVKTGDGGQNWELLLDDEDIGYPNVFFKDEDHGWVVANAEGYTAILYTTNGGANWQEGTLPSDETGIGSPGGYYIVTDVAMTSLDYGYAVGYNIFDSRSVVLKTTDGGVNWEFDDYTGDAYGELYGIQMIDNRTGYAFGGHMSIVKFYNPTNDPPVANAGADRIVDPGAVVTLDGSASYDPDGDEITFAWVQTEGPAITFDDPTSATPTFTTVSSDAKYTLELTVTDELGLSDKDDVLVTAGEPSDDDDDDDTTGGDDDDDDDDEDDGGCCG